MTTFNTKTSAFKPTMETLEERVVMNADIVFSGSGFNIVGGDYQDVVHVYQDDDEIVVEVWSATAPGVTIDPNNPQENDYVEHFEEDFDLEDVSAMSFRGRNGNDYFENRTNVRNYVYGESGNDTIRSGGGNDYIRGGAGDDRLEGGAGNDRIYGEDGNDFIRGNDGNDKVVGGFGNDFILGNAGRDLLYGDRRDYDMDRVWYQDINKDLSVELSDSIYQYTTRRLKQFVTDVDSDGHDWLWGGSDEDVMVGGGGDDYLHGQSGGDLIYGGKGSDTIQGGFGTNYLFGGDDHDRMYAVDTYSDSQTTEDRAIMYGGNGNDYMVGSRQDDYLNGEGGSDHLIGGEGVDMLWAIDGRQGDLIEYEYGVDYVGVDRGDEIVRFYPNR